MLEIILLGAMTLTLGTIIFMVGGGVASQPLPEIINFAIDKSPYLLAKIVRILTSFAVSIIFFIFGELVVAIIGAKIFVLYYPHRFSMAALTDPAVGFWWFLYCINLFVVFIFGICIAKYFYTKALLWEVRRYFRNRINKRIE